MAKFDTYYHNGTAMEFVRRSEGQRTIDDPVGNYLFERMMRKPDARVRVSKGSRTCRELIENFEKGTMLKQDYDAIAKRINTDALSYDFEKRKASPFLKERITRELFGDFKEMPKEKQKELVYAAGTKATFMAYIRPYLEAKLEQLPELSARYKEEIKKKIEQGKLEDISATLEPMFHTINFHLDFYSNKIRRMNGGNQMLNYYYDAGRRGKILEAARIFRQIETDFISIIRDEEKRQNQGEKTNA